ncbi:cytochrome c oxidase subunit 5B, mitochondrial-like [Lycorma delicatula]|uniref:cytochrome c oxidase subunit 5B, mitochondrial-like n=1 Tax=Lycorma delicatula TaxID=130591 RepID=UPI003F51932A
MALRLSGRLFSLTNRGFFTSAKRNIFGAPEDLPSPIKIATGLAKKEALAIEAGNEDPFDMNVVKRGVGTKDKPTLIPSAFESRLLGCICHEDSLYINWMCLYKGAPQRCNCGHYYQLVYKEPFC